MSQIPLAPEILLNTSNLAVTLLLAIEVATLKQSLRENDAIKLQDPALIQMVKGWVA